MKVFKTIIALSRPRFWIYLAGPYVLGYTAGLFDSITIDAYIQLSFIKLFFFFLIPANIFLYGINDLFDKDTDSHNEKKNHQEIRTTQNNTRIYIIAVILSCISGIYVFDQQTMHVWQLLLLFLILSFCYSAPPIRFKTKPFLDSASNILYGLPGIIGYVQSSNTYPSIDIWIGILCWTAAMHLFSAIPDIEPDTKVGIHTTATTLGRHKSLVVCVILWFISASITVIKDPLLIISFIYPLIPIIVLSNKHISINKVYWLFPSINAFCGFILFIYLFLHNIK